MAANTYTLISSNTLASTATSVTFSSIPATYTDLLIKHSARSNSSNPYDDAKITFNGSSAAAYSYTWLLATTNSVTGTGATGDTSIDPYYAVNGATSTTNTFSSNEFYIPSYTASQSKVINGFGATENNSTTTNNQYVSGMAALWGNNAAITSITFTPNIGPFSIGSSFYLYGIKNS